MPVTVDAPKPVQVAPVAFAESAASATNATDDIPALATLTARPTRTRLSTEAARLSRTLDRFLTFVAGHDAGFSALLQGGSVVETSREAAARGVGAFLIEGRMVDAPFIRRAEAVVAAARRLGLLPSESGRGP